MAYRQNKSDSNAKPSQRSSQIRHLSSVCILMLAVFQACDKTVQPGQDAARIVIDESIDGVRIGDDSATVVQKLGPPTSIIVPRTPAWLFAYDSGTHAGMSLTIGNYARSRRLGVTSISVSAPYPGTTANGIGVGVDQAFLLSRLGNPTDTLPTLSGLLVRYFYSNTTFNIGYTNDTVTSLAIAVKN
jgi:hypothetical protein